MFTLLYLVCPGLLHAVGETSYGIQVWFNKSHIVFTICLYIYLYLRCKIYSYPVKQIKIIFSQQKRKQPSLPFQNSNLMFSVTTLYTTSLALLSYLTASVSRPIPLSAANCFSYLKLSVCNPSYLSPMVS
jgi:hypothetical protein